MRVSAQQLNSASENKDIKDINFDDIYYCKSLSQDATYTIAVKNIRQDDGSTLHLHRFLPSRQAWTNDVYYFPDYTPECLSLGKPTEYRQVDIQAMSYEDRILSDMKANISDDYSF